MVLHELFQKECISDPVTCDAYVGWYGSLAWVRRLWVCISGTAHSLISCEIPVTLWLGNARALGPPSCSSFFLYFLDAKLFSTGWFTHADSWRTFKSSATKWQMLGKYIDVYVIGAFHPKQKEESSKWCLGSMRSISWRLHILFIFRYIIHNSLWQFLTSRF